MKIKPAKQVSEQAPKPEPAQLAPDPHWRENPKVWRSRRRRDEGMVTRGIPDWKP